MSYLMPGEKLEEQLPKLIPAVLSLYKKHTETFYISKVSAGLRAATGGKGVGNAPREHLIPTPGSIHARPHLPPPRDRPQWWELWGGLQPVPLLPPIPPALVPSCSAEEGTLLAAISQRSLLRFQSLCQILEASVDIGSRSLDVQLDALMGTLHPQVGVGGSGRDVGLLGSAGVPSSRVLPPSPHQMLTP